MDFEGFSGGEPRAIRVFIKPLKQRVFMFKRLSMENND